ELKLAVEDALDREGSMNVALGMRIGHPKAMTFALAIVSNENANNDRRLELIRILGEVPQPAAVVPLLTVLRESKNRAVRQTALTTLQRYDEPRIAETVLDLYAAYDADLKATA